MKHTKSGYEQHHRVYEAERTKETCVQRSGKKALKENTAKPYVIGIETNGVISID